MGADYQCGISRHDIRTRRTFSSLEGEPLLALFEGMSGKITNSDSKYNLMWVQNEDLLLPYFKNRKAFAHFMGYAFKGEKFTIEQIIAKRITTGKYKQFIKHKQAKL